ncbi:MAG: glycosyltransferase family 4 protein [Candidatus Korobacteraceae bacterium]|jgi:glycosyltransferase involved in cell wall biosynthesis
MSTLVLDARWLNTGLGTYTLNLIRGLHQYGNFGVRLLTLPKYRDCLRQYNYEITITDVPIYSISEQFRIAWAAHGSDLLHVPHYNAPIMRRGTLLVTIHDLTHILDATQRNSLKSWVYAQPMLRLAAVRADHVFTVSEYSKRQIIEHLGVDEGKVTVVYNAIGPHIFSEPRDAARAKMQQNFSFDGPYIVFVGNLKPSKNVAGLLRAFSIVKSRGRIPHRLLAIGDDKTGRPAMMQLAHQLGLEGTVIFVPRVSDEQLRAAYSGADLTVMPSFEEGFGLPVIESMACGTPVACSHCASLPEVGGPAAEYFDPYDVESIAAAIETVLLSSDRWGELQQLGLQRVGCFTCAEFAQRHLTIYRRFLSEN